MIISNNITENKIPQITLAIVRPQLYSVLMFIISGYFLGIPHVFPSLWLVGWLGLFILTFALHSTKKTYLLSLGFALFIFVYEFSGHPWYMTSVYMAVGQTFEPLKIVALWLFFMLIAMVIPHHVSFLTGLLLSKKLKLPVFIWFPFSFLLGEHLVFNFTGLSMGAWLYSQWEAEYVLRAVASLGWNSALLTCLFVPIAMAEAVIKKKTSYLFVSLAGIFILLIQPQLNKQIPEILFETGVVYTNYETLKNKENADRIKLLIWPEVARTGRPRVKEGKVEGVKSRLPINTENVFHLIGQETRIEEGLQNSALALSPEGDLLAVRAKKVLFPIMEKPFFGFIFPSREDSMYIPGKLPPLMEFDGKKIIPLICFEQLDRSLVNGVMKNEPDLIAILARDTIVGNSKEVYDQFTAMAVLLSVETGVPVVRSTMEGPAAIIAPDGRVLARSERYGNGILVINDGL